MLFAFSHFSQRLIRTQRRGQGYVMNCRIFQSSILEAIFSPSLNSIQSICFRTTPSRNTRDSYEWRPNNYLISRKNYRRLLTSRYSKKKAYWVDNLSAVEFVSQDTTQHRLWVLSKVPHLITIDVNDSGNNLLF